MSITGTTIVKLVARKPAHCRLTEPLEVIFETAAGDKTTEWKRGDKPFNDGLASLQAKGYILASEKDVEMDGATYHVYNLKLRGVTPSMIAKAKAEAGKPASPKASSSSLSLLKANPAYQALPPTIQTILTGLAEGETIVALKAKAKRARKPKTQPVETSSSD